MKPRISKRALRPIRLEDGHAHYMGGGCWALERFEEIDGLDQRHTFGITEDDRQALLTSEGAPTVPLEDGEAHFMGDGCFVLVRTEQQDGEEVRHVIGMTIEGLKRLGDAMDAGTLSQSPFFVRKLAMASDSTPTARAPNSHFVRS